MNKKVLWITQTAILTALLVVSQAFTAGLGNTIITGSIVNMILIIGAVVCGPATGICVAAISPVFAKLVGIGPFWEIIPFIMLGNIAIVLVWYLVTNKFIKNPIIAYPVACVLGAGLKFVVIYFTVVKLAVPFILQLQEKQAMIISASFSVPQLITALIGGAVAMLIAPILKKAVKHFS